MLLIDRLMLYLPQVWTYSAFRLPEQVFLSVCPTIVGKLSKRGVKLLLIVLALSLLHYRFFHIFFPLILLYAGVPSFSDRGFWRGIILYNLVNVIWVVMAVYWLRPF